MARVLISLVGGRPVPNVLVALHLKPDLHYLIPSQDSIGPGRDYDKTISALPATLRPSEPLTVRPYVLQDTLNKCRMILEKHKNDDIIINTTLGPKTMAFGAYDAAKEHRLNGRQVDVCYLAREGLVHIFADSVENVEIGLAEYFSSYDWIVRFKTDPTDDRLDPLLDTLVKDLPTSHRLIQILRNNDGGKGRRTRTFRRHMDNSEYLLLVEIEQHGFLSNVRRDTMSTSWTINSDEDARLLLKGDWLEYYVYRQAKTLRTKINKPLVEKAGWGVEGAGGQGEIDFVAMYNGQVIMASCKTEDSIKRAWFEELHAKMNRLGKGMCSALLVSTVSRNTRSPDDLKQLQKWENQHQIILVLAEDLPRLPLILQKVILADEKAEPLDIPIYPRI